MKLYSYLDKRIMDYTVQDIPNISKEQKKNIMDFLEYKRKKHNKILFWCIAIEFILAGLMGWFSIVALGYGLNSLDSFLKLILCMIIMYIALNCGGDYSDRGIIAAILLQLVCICLWINLSFLPAVFPIISMVLYLKRYNHIKYYEALKKEDGFPYFTDWYDNVDKEYK